jgi:hypothetical protein
LQTVFRKFLWAYQGCEFGLTSGNRAFAFSLAKKFKSKELTPLVLDALRDAMTLKSAAERLCLKIHLGIEANAELDFLAWHFHELGSNLRDYFDCEALWGILLHDSLAISLKIPFSNSSRFDLPTFPVV